MITPWIPSSSAGALAEQKQTKLRSKLHSIHVCARSSVSWACICTDMCCHQVAFSSQQLLQ